MNETKIYDHGKEVFSSNFRRLAIQNNNYRTALWTGKDLQVTLMSIPVKKDIGMERHTNLDQLLTVASGSALARFGRNKDEMTSVRLTAGDSIIIPENTWHNLINAGRVPLKLLSVYAPPQHPFGTVQPVRPEHDEH